MGNLRYTNLPSETPEEDALAELALDVSAHWSRFTDPLWRQLNADLWERTGNPWIVLQMVSSERLKEVTSRPEFRDTLNGLLKARAEDAREARWFQKTHANSPLTSVAYFSMEYMLSEALPIYSGGLGNVAGDQLKAADDLGVPVVGVGLLYSQGYFRQELDRDGGQRAVYPFNDPGQLPIRPLRNSKGDWLRLSIPFPGCELWIRAWEVQVGQAKLYLLDTNDPVNYPEYRSITSELYGGGPDLRIRQEIVLGIGGWRLLGALGIQPEVCHLNEGHAAFAVLERAAAFMEESGLPFDAALEATRAGNLFTTHTPVEAGFDRFPAELMQTYFPRYCAERLRISFEDLMTLGRVPGAGGNEPFNMAYLAMHGSGAVNGVSRLHGEVSRELFQPMFPRWPTAEVPVRHVTNGVHTPTWDCAASYQLWAEVCGHKCWRGDLEQMESRVAQVPDDALWNMRSKARAGLVEYVRKQYARQVAIQGCSEQEIAAAGRVFRADALTLGFARRFASYKRPTLLLRDPERLLRILQNGERPVQLVIAGKAHPNDSGGQQLIRQWTEFIRDRGSASPVVFLSDYDMLMTEQLVGGVDVWINTPRRPWEASGTSGMKVLVNGGVNLSELDGWWAEAYSADVGWAIGDGQEHDSDAGWDAAEANELYELLEREIIPQFYERNQAGIPEKWTARMRASMMKLTPQYSANRTVREYTENHYVPAAESFRARTKDGGRMGANLAAWRQKLAAGWGSVSIGAVHVESREGRHFFEVAVYPGALSPDDVRVELFADARDGEEMVRQAMDAAGPVDGKGFRYQASVDGRRNAGEFTPRVIPYHPDACVPLEANQILWQR